jgi:hypothetical protein
MRSDWPLTTERKGTLEMSQMKAVPSEVTCKVDPRRRYEENDSVDVVYAPFGLTSTAAEMFIRFAVEFVNRADWAEANPQGIDDAYSQTLHNRDPAHDGVNGNMHELAEIVRPTLSEDFATWTRTSGLLMIGEGELHEWALVNEIRLVGSHG